MLLLILLLYVLPLVVSFISEILSFLFVMGEEEGEEGFYRLPKGGEDWTLLDVILMTFMILIHFIPIFNIIIMGISVTEFLKLTLNKPVKYTSNRIKKGCNRYKKDPKKEEGNV